MLKKLHVENYILIPELTLDFESGFTGITGETGSGKSIILGALGLVMGVKADFGVVRNADKKCIIEAVFNLNDYNLEPFFDENDIDFEEDTTLRREINSNGKSRAFINDTPVNLTTLKELTSFLIDIHSQHETLLLKNSLFQTQLIDDFAQNNEHIAQYAVLYHKFKKIEVELSEKKAKADADFAEKSYLQFQFEELENAKLIENEQEEAEAELKMLTHADEIKSKLYQSFYDLSEREDNILSELNNINSLLKSAGSYHEEINKLSERLGNSLFEIEDISREINRNFDKIFTDEARQTLVSERLNLIYNLQQKHRVNTVGQLLDIQNNISKKLEDISLNNDELEKLEKTLSETKLQLKNKAETISKRRKASLPEFQNKIIELLSDLGMKSADFVVDIEDSNNFMPNGSDYISFLFTANKGAEVKELSKVASGGEMSRLMLALKYISVSKRNMPTLIFDEIDTGVSGEIAGKVGAMIDKMSNSRQIIIITHLPQIIGMADEHLWVYKEEIQEGTISKIKKLNYTERVNQIAGMISNENITEASISTAKELLVKQNNKN